MLYLRSINRLVLIGVAMLGCFVSTANASLFQFEHSDTISVTGIPGTSIGDSALITIGLDNGSSSNFSQVWTGNDLQFITFNFDSGGLLATFTKPFGGALDLSLGSFETDGTGQLDSVFSHLYDASFGTDFITNGPTPVWWQLNGDNYMYWTESNGLGLANIASVISPEGWTQVQEVPIPAAACLFISALVGLVVVKRKRQ